MELNFEDGTPLVASDVEEAAETRQRRTGSIRNRLLGAFSAIILLTVIVGVVAIISQNQTTSTVNSLVDIDQQVAQLSLEMENALLDANQNIRTYLLNYSQIGFEAANEQYASVAFESLEEARRRAAEIRNLLSISGAPSSEIANTEQINEITAESETIFAQTIQLLEQRGLGSAGIVGQFESQLRTFEANITFVDNPQVNIDLLLLGNAQKDYLLSATPENETAVRDVLTQLRTNIEAVDQLSTSEMINLTSLADSYEANLNQLVNINNEIAANIERGDEIVNIVEPISDELILFADNNAQLSRNNLADLSNTVTLVVTGAVAVALLIGLLLAVILSFGITRPIQAIVSVFRKFEEGDFEVRAEVERNDELGQMANSLNSMLEETAGLLQQTEQERDQLQDAILQLLDEVSDAADGDLTVQAIVTDAEISALADSFNYMIGQLRDLVGNVYVATERVSGSATTIQETAESLASRSESQALRLTSASEEIANMALSIREVSQTADRSAHVGKQALASAQQGNKAVQDTIYAMEDIRAQVQETAKRIKRLGESSQEIGEIVQLINEIADRTSILALNASIQAAMAGEAGRGFAVVAEEVEQLADRAGKSTREINALISSIQSETNEAVAAMESTTSQVVRGSALANEAGTALNEIESVSTNLTDLINSISGLTQQQASSSETIATTMQDISSRIQENAENTKKTAVFISTLTSYASDLRQSVSTFRLPETIEEPEEDSYMTYQVSAYEE